MSDDQAILPRRVRLIIRGELFRCQCGCEVFVERADGPLAGLFRCSVCSTFYEGEPASESNDD